MGKRYFVISDIHSFYSQMISALNKAGYDKNNDNHVLIVCGDIFDRGNETMSVYQFLRSIPKERRILIKGNHESLFLELLNKNRPESYDVSNGTVSSFIQIANHYQKGRLDSIAIDFWNIVTSLVSKSEVTDWLRSGEWVNYYELGDYVFVHSFIPIETDGNSINVWDNWRSIDLDGFWLSAKWANPYVMYLHGLWDKEKSNHKRLVCGHWHTSDFYQHLDNMENQLLAKTCPLYISDDIIAIDACTAATRRCNVLVLDENLNIDYKSSVGVYNGSSVS